MYCPTEAFYKGLVAGLMSQGLNEQEAFHAFFNEPALDNPSIAEAIEALGRTVGENCKLTNIKKADG